MDPVIGRARERSLDDSNNSTTATEPSTGTDDDAGADDAVADDAVADDAAAGTAVAAAGGTM
jgi:hypothetical protein